MINTSYSNLFHSYWEGATNLFHRKTQRDKTIELLSKNALVNALSDEIENGQNTEIKKLQNTPLTVLVNKTGHSEKELLSKYSIQHELGKGQKTETVEKKVQSIFSKMFSTITTVIDHLLDTALKAFGYYEIGKEVRWSWDASSRLQVYAAFLSYPSFIFLALAATMSLPAAALLTTVIVVGSFLALAAYIQYYKPCPQSLNGFINLTKQAENGEIEAVYGRDKEMSDLINSLQNKQGVMLLGLSGVGKTELVKGLAVKIARGEAGSLNNKKLFMLNAADLGDKLSEVMDRLSGHEKEVIFFIEEICALWKGKNTIIVDTLKTFIDRFPYCVTATTAEEFTKHNIAEEKAIIRRLEPRVIKAMDLKAHKIMLSNHVEKEAPDAQLEKGVLDYVLETVTKSKTEVQSHIASKRIVSDAIRNLYCDPKNSLKNKISEVEQEIEAIKSSFRQSSIEDIANFDQESSGYQKLKVELETLRNFQQRQEQKIAQLKKITTLSNAIKKDIFTTNIKQKVLSEQHRNWLINFFFILPALEKSMTKLTTSEELATIKTKIDKELIAAVAEKALF